MCGAYKSMITQIHFPVYNMVCALSADEEYASRTAVVAGWGKTGEHDAPSDVPRQVGIDVKAVDTLSIALGKDHRSEYSIA